MTNYNNRTVEPILRAIAEAMKRTFLTKTARTQGQSIDYFSDPFKLVPISQWAEIADKFTRNEILTSNEIRQKIGIKPSSDPKADQLINSNMPQGDTGVPIPGSDTSSPPAATPDPTVSDSTAAFDGMDNAVAAAYSSIGVTPPKKKLILPPPGNLDPGVVSSALDDVDKLIDQTFSGLGLDGAT